MRHPILIKLFSAFLNLITFFLASVIVVAFDSLHQSGDYISFLIYTIPFAVALAISGGTLVQFVRTSNAALRKFWFFTIATLASLGWLYVIFVLLWGDARHAFSMPLFYLWVAGSFAQLVFLDRYLTKPAIEVSMPKKVLRLFALPLIVIFVLRILVVCYDRYLIRESEKQEQGNTHNNSPAPFSFSVADRDTLGMYFSDVQINELEDYLHSYKHIKTAHDLCAVYQQINSIYGNLADSLTAKTGRYFDDSIIDFEPINTIVTGIHFEHYEGDAVLINPDLSAFKKTAETTAEKSDDDFIAIMIATYGEEKYFSYPKWLVQTTDNGHGSSLLGDNICLNILLQIQAALASSKEFEPELNEIRETIFYDILDAFCYEYDSLKIIAEINRITTAIKISEEEKTKINARLLEFKQPSKGLHLGCRNKECNCAW